MMKLDPARTGHLKGRYHHLKAPDVDVPPAQRDPKVITTVSEMLSTIEQGGMDSVMQYAGQLDRWDGRDPELRAGDVERLVSGLSAELRAALDLGRERTAAFAEVSRSKLTDFEAEIAPGLVTGVRYVPVRRVGAYLPAGRFPLLASASMTVNVARVAGVPSVLACTPPQPHGGPDPAVVYAAHISGADRIFVLGGVQALAAMAFGLLGEPPVDMLVGAGNAYVAEAKRQLFGAVAIDLPAGPSEVAVIADDTADPVLVAADLLGQAEHGPESPAALVTTSETLGQRVLQEVARQVDELKTQEIVRVSWADHGSIIVAEDREVAAELMDDLAPEHLEIITADDEWYHEHLSNYGSIFLGTWSTVAYSDKGMAGTNHTLPTAGGARHSAGLSVSRFLKALTYQRVARAATPLLADAVDVISEYEGMAAHRATATLRTARFAEEGSV